MQLKNERDSNESVIKSNPTKSKKTIQTHLFVPMKKKKPPLEARSEEDLPKLAPEMEKELYQKNVKDIIEQGDFNEISLGQVFTPPHVARFMVNFIQFANQGAICILDPCAGKNIFFNTICQDKRKRENTELHAVEYDSRLESTIRASGNFDKLFIQDFFDFSLKEKYDYIIMNPPYVRQEILKGSILNTKSKIRSKIRNLFEHVKVPSSANLYYYFFLKTSLHLKREGKIIAITYDSWLYTKFGEHMITFLSDNFTLQYVFHFKVGAFKNINVGATILVLQTLSSRNYTHYAEFENADILTGLHENDFAKIKREAKKIPIAKLRNLGKDSVVDFGLNIFTRLENISHCQIKRGTNAIINKYFLFSEPDDEKQAFLRPIIKNTKKIKHFEVNETEFDYILDIPENPPLPIRRYIDSISSEILAEPEKFKSIRRKIKKKQEWFRLNKVNPGNIFFNYYIRNNYDFLLNPRGVLISDNFYILNVKDQFLMLSILNSAFTKEAIKQESRSQGSGLTKLQVYEFQKVKVLDPSVLDEPLRETLRELGVRLAKTLRKSRDDIIKEINFALFKYYNNKVEQQITLEEMN